jgi:hypothetical protein
MTREGGGSAAEAVKKRAVNSRPGSEARRSAGLRTYKKITKFIELPQYFHKRIARKVVQNILIPIW